jgi:tetratricopeptide (TPR) repeat protein
LDVALLLLLCLVLQSEDFDELSAQLHLETGNAFLQQGLLEQAEHEFHLALEAREDCHSALLGLGRVYTAYSSYERAAEYFRDFVAVSPDDYRGYYELACLMLDTGRPDSAFMMTDSAFVRAPTNPDVWLLSGRTALASADTVAAERWFIRGLQDPGAVGLESRMLLGSVYRATGRSVESRELLLPAAQAGYAPAWWGLAMGYLSWNDYMRAVDAIQNYLGLAPGGVYADSAFLVLQALAESGDFIVPD